MAVDCKQFAPCALDENGCLTLSQILEAFNASVSEEQAWAVCFQSAKCMLTQWNADSSSCYCLVGTSNVYIHKDGYVHRSTVQPKGKDVGCRKPATAQSKLVHTLGCVVFEALDFLLEADEERVLSRPLEALIEAMTGRDDPEDDEGIERDVPPHDPLHEPPHDPALAHVMMLCADHLNQPEEADFHYKAVCRALVAEVLELSSFLQNISNKSKLLTRIDEDGTDKGTLEKLKIQDWARLWMQVIHQLRQGVKLKKIDPDKQHSIEYALTPYEMLLDDIRSRRYKLKQVMVNGDIPPRVKKDAHALILDFIRSRPPLVPVSQRQLPPTPPQPLTLYEKLLVSIRQQHKLKPTPSNKENSNPKKKVESSRTKLECKDNTPSPQRRLIKADITFRSSTSLDDLDDIPSAEDKLPLQNGRSRKNSLVRSLSQTDSLCNCERRHSITVCESPPKTVDHTPDEHKGHLFCQHSSRSRADFWQSSQWQSLECLSLTLEEVVHIRNVLTKAELESVDPALYDDISKGKVCFTCKQVKFSFFGTWGVKCKMCERTVCDKCSSKMRIPTEHFARIPVYMLSPTPSPPPEEESSHSFWKFSEVFSNRSEMRDEPETTPKLSRQKTTLETGQQKRKITFCHSESFQVAAPNVGRTLSSLPSNSQKRPPLERSKTLRTETIKPPRYDSSPEDKMKRPMVPVCRECKIMVSNIITASQDTVSFERRKKNSKTWPQKRGSINSVGFMDTVIETPCSSPDDVFSPTLSSREKAYTP